MLQILCNSLSELLVHATSCGLQGLEVQRFGKMQWLNAMAVLLKQPCVQERSPTALRCSKVWGTLSEGTLC